MYVYISNNAKVVLQLSVIEYQSHQLTLLDIFLLAHHYSGLSFKMRQ